MKDRIIQQENPLLVYLFFSILSWVCLKKAAYLEMKRMDWKERYERYIDHKYGL
ncbi:hypothetical protein GLW00_06380 [Halobacillus litoralis]|uniref:Uncharacterized protein n=1 Tax=Halobacillus litoralis TaxID=45668 RepID=A0A845F9Y0_9BACI|nr:MULTISPECIES: hypothetical protein [Halobacillus]MEC3885723.1 hypothetical protein [Halobacillus sp. HZG1]MYL70465.1 hypothetical protein [Halobacillus litoralis]